MERPDMETVKSLERRERLDWDYDGDADVLYVSVGRPRKAIGVDIGQGVVIRYDEAQKEVIGVTILGVRARLIESLRKGKTDGSQSRLPGRARGASRSPR